MFIGCNLWTLNPEPINLDYIYHIFNKLQITCIHDDVKGNFIQKTLHGKARNIIDIGWVVQGLAPPLATEAASLIEQ